MAFVRFAPISRRGRRTADTPMVRFSVCRRGRGILYLNTRARNDLCLALPAALDVWIDAESQLVALRATDGGGVGTIRVQRTGSAGATTLMREMSIAPGHYSAHMDGDRLIIDVGHPLDVDDKR